uniref:Uncharacterized protein n=1 Tax=Populus alba TaxID=43335 RepID=A0A4U5Q7N1_POPAL|nr:hypothetical protein D5086_0000144460 [Populus alba]
MACQGTCACSVEVPKKEEEVSTQPETVVQEDTTTVVGACSVEVPKKEEEVSTQPETVVQEDATTVVAPEEVKTEEKDASSAKKEEEPVKAEVGSNHKPPSHIQHAQADQPCIHSVQLLASFDGVSPLKQTISSDLVELAMAKAKEMYTELRPGFATMEKA